MHLVYPYLEKAVGYVITFVIWPDRNLSCCVQNNLKGHQVRNSKTAFMYMIAITFVLFAGTSFDLEKNLLISMLKMLLGSDLVGITASASEPLDEPGIRSYLNTKKSLGVVEEFTFMSGSLVDTIQTDDINAEYSVEFSSMAKFPIISTEIYGVEKNYLRTINLDLYYPNEVDNIDLSTLPNGDKDAVEALYSTEKMTVFNNSFDQYGILTGVDKIVNWYTDKNNIYSSEIKAIIPEGLRGVLSLNTQTKAYIGIIGNGNGRTNSTSYRCIIRALATKMPGFFFTSFSQARFFATIMVSMEQFSDMTYRMVNYTTELTKSFSKFVNYTEGIPKQRILVKLSKNIDKYTRENIINGIKSYFTNDAMYLIDLQDYEESANETLALLELFLIIVSIISLILSFFLLLISMISNIRENIWEFGVLRAVGLTSFQVSRIFIYESFTVIISALILGIIVGMCVSITLTLQINMYLELPFEFTMPTTLLLVMLLMTFVTTFCAAYFPGAIINKKQISDIAKGLA